MTNGTSSTASGDNSGSSAKGATHISAVRSFAGGVTKAAGIVQGLRRRSAYGPP